MASINATHDPSVETYLSGTKLVTSASADFQFVSSFSNTLFPDTTSTRAQKFLLCQSNNLKFITNGTLVFDYYSNKDLTPEQRRMDEVSLSRGIVEYLINLNAFKALLPLETDTDDTVDYANLRFVLGKTIEDVTAVQALLPDACPIT